MPDFAQALTYLDGLQKFGIKLGLEQVAELLNAAGSPERGLRFIHIAGSNGKGSCSAMLNAALRAAGFSVGLFTSPHLISPLERIRLNGRAIAPAEFSELADLLRPAAEAMHRAGRCPTYFEFSVALAASCFARHHTDWVIWETGMGGRLDATNVVMPHCSVITGIALEHQQYLGGTLNKIALEKAGIIKRGRPVFCGAMPEPALTAIRERCREAGSGLQVIPEAECSDIRVEFPPGGACRQSFNYAGRRITLGLPGKYQRQNFKLAFLILQWLAGDAGFSLEQALAGLAAARWPARIQMLADGSIIDGGHNPDGAAALAEALAEILPGQKLAIIFGCFADKDAAPMLRALAGLAAEFIFVPLRGDRRRSRTGAELTAMLRQAGYDIPCRTAADAAAGLNLTTSARRLITGSLYLAGDALRLLAPEAETLNI